MPSKLIENAKIGVLGLVKGQEGLKSGSLGLLALSRSQFLVSSPLVVIGLFFLASSLLGVVYD